MADVAIVDDGELGLAREVLWELGVDFEDRDKDGPRPDGLEPARLLVCSVARATADALERPLRRGSGPRPVWIALATRESLARRQQLIGAGFDYLVRTPVHPTALRQLITRALFRGEDLRRVPRVVVGHPVTYRSGWRRRQATLVDLSARGARIFAPVSMVKGARLTLCLAEPLVREPVDLPAVVLRAQDALLESGPPGEAAMALRFEPLSMAQCKLVARLIERLMTGPPSLEQGAGADPRSDDSADGAPALSERERRSVYLQAVLAWAQEDDSCLIVGRNLSMGGMCIDDHAELELGQMVRIALEDEPGQHPFHVGGVVVRDAGDAGIALRFEWIEEGCEPRLRALVEQLPAIDDLGAGVSDDDTPSGVLFSRLVGAGDRVGQTLTSLTGLLRRG